MVKLHAYEFKSGEVLGVAFREKQTKYIHLKYGKILDSMVLNINL